MPGEVRECRVCASLSLSELNELDQLLVDPGRWPASLWEAVGKPTKMTPSARRFGQIAMGEAWLRRHRYDLQRQDVATHVRRHVIAVPRLDEMFTQGVPEGAQQLLDFWSRALAAGEKAMSILLKDMENGKKFSTTQLLEIAEFSSRLAVVASRGNTPFKALDEPPPLLKSGSSAGSSGFMGVRPSARVAHHRQRVVNGAAVIVADEGPHDRELYNDRADAEGGPRL